MQENEFEKQIRQKMQELTVAPGEEIWKNVFSEIKKEKRKKRAFIFLFAFALLLAGGVLYFSTHTNKQAKILTDNALPNKTNALSNKDTNLTIDTNTTGRRKPINSTAANANNTIKATDRNGFFSNKTSKVSKSFAASSFKGEKEMQADQMENAKAEVAIGSVPKVKELNEKNVNENGGNTFNQSLEKNRVDSLLHDLESNKDTLKINLPTNDTALKKDTGKALLTGAKPFIKIKNSTSKKGIIGFTFFAGTSNNIAGLSSQKNVYSDYNSAQSSGSSLGSSGAVPGSSTIAPLRYSGSLSYGFGVYLKKQLSKPVSLTAGVNYHFSSASSLVGAKNESARTFYDSISQTSATVSEFYSSGQTVKYINKYYFVEVPINFIFQLNKNQHKALCFTAGISPAYLVTSNALFANSSQNAYYKNNSQFKRLQLAAQAGISFTVHSAPHSAISIGPEVQYGLNNMVKQSVNNNLHFFSAAIKANINLK